MTINCLSDIFAQLFAYFVSFKFISYRTMFENTNKTIILFFTSKLDHCSPPKLLPERPIMQRLSEMPGYISRTSKQNADYTRCQTHQNLAPTPKPGHLNKASNNRFNWNYVHIYEQVNSTHHPIMTLHEAQNARVCPTLEGYQQWLAGTNRRNFSNPSVLLIAGLDDAQARGFKGASVSRHRIIQGALGQQRYVAILL